MLSDLFAARFGVALDSAGISQSEFARLAGVSRAYVNQLLHGATSPRLDTVEKYAEVLEMPAWLLLVDLEDKAVRDQLHLATETNVDPNLLELCRRLNMLNGNQRQVVLAAIRGILQDRSAPQ